MKNYHWVGALFLGYWAVLLFAVAVYYSAILTLYITRPFMQEIRANVNEPAAYVLYKRGQE